MTHLPALLAVTLLAPDLATGGEHSGIPSANLLDNADFSLPGHDL